MRLKYVGPHRAVDVPIKFGGFITVKQGETENLPDSMCEGLLKQPENWQLPDKKITKKEGGN